MSTTDCDRPILHIHNHHHTIHSFCLALAHKRMCVIFIIYGSVGLPLSPSNFFLVFCTLNVDGSAEIRRFTPATRGKKNVACGRQQQHNGKRYIIYVRRERYVENFNIMTMQAVHFHISKEIQLVCTL